jgi:xanthine dehydrogenase accessory factor
MSIYQVLSDLEVKGEQAVLCTVTGSQGSTPRHVGSKMIVFPDGRTEGTVGGGEVESRVVKEAIAAFSDGKAKKFTYSLVDPASGDPGVCGGTLEIFIEPILGKPLMLIIGGGHVGKAVVHLANWLGFKVAVSDDRPGFCTPESAPEADVFYPVSMKELPSVCNITPQTYIVMTTRGVAIDVPGLPAILETPAAYIGLIGSKRRWLTTRAALLKDGYPEEKLNRVQSPIGLELNAETPEEIAVSIMAEIIMLRNGGSGERMRI